MDDLDRLMDQPAQPAASDPIDSAMDGYMNEQAGAVRAGASLAIDANPDEIARQKRVAKALGIPVAAVEADPEFASREQKLREVDTATSNAPALRQKFTDADFAKLAHDDLDNLSGFEQLIRSVKRGWTAGLRGENAANIDIAVQGLNSLDRGQVQNEPLRPRLNFATTDSGTLQRIRGQYVSMLSDSARAFAERGKKLEGLAPTGATQDFYEANGFGNAIKTLASDPFEIAGNVALESLGIMAPSIPAITAAGLATGPVGLAATTGATSFNMEYTTALAEEIQKSGVDLTDQAAVQAFVASPQFVDAKRKANIKAAVIGAFDAATAGVAGVRLRPSTSGNLAAQTGVQMAGGGAGEAAGSAASGQDLSASSVLAEMIGEIPGATIDVATMAGRNAIEYRAKSQRAESAANLAENLNQLAASSKVLQRDAETFEQFVAAAAEDGPADTVYIDGRMLMQSGMAPKLAELSPAVRGQLDRAIITGGDIAIPVGEYAARIAATDIAPQLVDHLKFDPAGFTRAEAADFMANEGDALQAEVERMLTEREDADTFRASQDVVKQDILWQLNTAGRFTPQVNEAYATLASSYSAVRAAQLGMTPEAFHQQRGMKVQGEAVAGQQYSQDGKLVTDTPAFQNWFGDSKVVDAEGKPLVVYHGGLKWDKAEMSGDERNALWASQEFTTAVSYADQYGAKDGEVKPLYLKIDNPLDLRDANTLDAVWPDDVVTERDLKFDRNRIAEAIAYAKENGYDGVIHPDTTSENHSGGDSYVVFKPEQVKLAKPTGDESQWNDRGIQTRTEGNRGTFDPNDPNILRQSENEPRDLVVTHNLTARNLLHAAKLGGIPVPSLAVTTKDNPLVDFGEITLVGPKEMADPKGYAGTKVFGADIYSPRYPRVEYQFTPNMRKRVEGMFKDGVNATDSSIDWEEVARRGAEEMARSAPFMWQFLKNNGIEPKIVRTEVAPLPPAIQPFANDTRFVHELVADPAFIEAVYSNWTDQLAEAYDDRAAAEAEIAQDRARAAERGVDYLVRDWASKVNRYRMDSANAGTVDRSATRRMLEDQIREAGLNQEAEAAAQGVFDEVGPNERIFQGFTNSGNRRYVAHTLENVVKILKKELRGGEGFNYGVGSIRSKFTPQFKSIKQIREAKGRLMDGAAFDKVKTEIDAEFVEVMESLRGYHASGKEFGFGDSVSSMMYDAATMGVPRAMRENGFDADVPVEVQQEVATFLGKLRTLPTEYFEAKILRDVDLAEFSAAVVPDDVQPEVIKALHDRGVKDIRIYKRGDEADRKAKIGELEHLFFQPDGGTQSPRGAFNPATSTVALLKNADLSTFLHESAHYFFESDIQLASELIGKESLTAGEQQIVDDVSRLLTWHGIQGDIREQLRQWHTMDFEEQRSHHERTAESFEAYLFSGKAPSLELQPIFQRFRAWLVNVYKSLKDFLARNPEAGKLTDEVRQVFDRMIATSEQIALAEQGRSMLPLFGDPAKSGMTPEEFAKYQAQGIDATNEAIQNLQAKGLRDLQWLANAKGRQVSRLKREARALRAEAELEARREVISQPVYRAWDFLTRKLGQEDKLPQLERKSDPDILDPTIDSLFVAIAKLGGIRKDQVISEWGVDPKDIPQSGLFGKPVWRVTDGLTLDGMAEALSQHGYLPTNEHGQYKLNDLGDRFLEELAGNTQYSHAHQPQDLLPGEQIANPGGLAAGRLDLAGLASIGVPVEVAAKLAELKMTAKEGLHPDLVAEMFGFTSGDELTRALAAAEKPKAAITGLADRLMLERHGELATPEAIERAADAAIHNEARARFVATEYNALAKATGQRRVLASAAKEFAAQMIARLKIRDIRPQQYANAEVRAAKASEKASKAGKMAEAAAEKRNQLVNTYATRAAYDAQDEVQSTLRAWSKLANGKGKAFDLDILNAVRAILGEYGIAPKTGQRAAEYLKAVQQYDPEIYAVIQDSVQRAEANAKPVKDMTLEELRGLRDEIDAITHLAKRSHQMEVDGNLLDLEDIQGELLGRMTEYGIPDKIAGEGQAVTRAEERMTKFKSLLAFARRVESWVGQMDGKEQMGPFRRFIWSRVSDAAVAYRTDKARYLKQFRDLVKAIAPSLKPQIVAAPELGYTFGKDSGGSAINEILHALLHTGNESNKRKLLLGRGWAVEVAPGQLDTTRWDSFIARMVQEGKLTREHFDFVQGTWDLLESMKPLAQKTHRDVFGRYFDEVTADGFTDPFGVSRRGGYVPAMVDSRVVKDANLRALADEDNAAMAYAFPTTPKGFTKTRTEYNRPLLLDLRTLSQHIDKVLLFSHLEMPVRDVQRALSKQVGETLNRIDNTAIPGMLLPWLNRSARQQVETPIAGSAGTMRFFSVLRSRAGAAAMFGNLANTVQQLTGFSLAAVKVKPGLLLSATADFMKSPREFAKAVSESSPYMNTRMANEIHAMTDAINDIMLNPSLLERAQAWTMRHAYFLQSAFDNTMSPIIWTAAYNQAVQNGSTHDDAVRLADGSVRQTQGAMQAEDISRIEGGNAFVRMFTQFAGYFNMNANLLGTEFARMMHDGGLRKNAGRGVFVFALGYLVPAVVGEAIIQAFRGGPGDDDDDGEYLDDWLAALFGWAPLRYATAMVPVGGQAVNATVNAWNGKPYDDRLATSPAISMLESAARAPVSAYKAIDGDASAQKAVRDVATLLSMTLGLPANIAARPVGYGAGVLDDAIDPTSSADFVRGLVTGQASAESKQ